MSALETLYASLDAADKEFEERATPLLAETRDLTDDETAKIEELRSSRSRIRERILQIEEDVKHAELVQEARTRLGTAAVNTTIASH